MNLPQAIDRFVNRHLVLKGLSEDTQRSYRGDLRHFSLFLAGKHGRVMKVADITNDDIEDFLFEQQKRLSSKTVKRRGSTLRSFFSWAKREGHAAPELTADVPLPKTTKPLPYCPSKEVVRDFLNTCTDPTVWAVVSTIYNTGLRIRELCSLKLTDVDLDQGALTVHNGKGGKDRQVPLNRTVQKVLRKYLRDIRPSTRSDNFFATRTGGLSVRWASTLIRTERRRQGKPEALTAHSFRHAFATHLYQQGCDLRKLKELMGHASLNTLDLYIRLGQNDLADAVNLLG